VLALHSARALLVKQQTMLANALRGLAAEFGLVAPLGFGKLAELVAQMEAHASVPEAARQAMRALHAQLGAVGEAAAGLEEAVVAHARRDETARRLATIPGVGPITASLIAATVTDVGLFGSARHFAAWLGLVPRQHSTGGKPRLGRITKAGNEQIRTLLVLGATSMVRRAGQWNSAAGAWIRGVLARRPARLATVALANKMARVAWALMARKEDYRPSGCGAAAAVAGAAA
jgi:error-prone DNA polymerase